MQNNVRIVTIHPNTRNPSIRVVSGVLFVVSLTTQNGVMYFRDMELLEFTYPVHDPITYS